MDKPFKAPPPYAIASVDNALRIATMLQLEGPLTVSEVARRLGVANSTAHRLLAMLVYRDFAVREADRTYRVGPVLELAAHSQSAAARLRAAALPHLHRLAEMLDESANLTVRTGDTVRFVASVESRQALRVGSREGMVFPAHRTTAGLLLLAELPPDRLEALYAADRYDERPGDRPDLDALRADLARVRRNGFALNQGRSERGVVAVGVPVRAPDGEVVAGLSVSMPSARYEKERLPALAGTLRTVADALERDLTR
ncbi:IclR family transcriptional regulator [Actinomadura montaniterrae]|uniref:IclR family transcriptional regulator n=1 Tax=Actinomadura montaniterrae TaxID=1803903 RepID=A0A6L3W2P4_9ACTN|nr:IclR family transcriptional regulator [Actinomadura montaniterrae]KAB2388501.1 IclR family transcriptional regulator [Actinomadura montaniterrae]